MYHVGQIPEQWRLVVLSGKLHKLKYFILDISSVVHGNTKRALFIEW